MNLSSFKHKKWLVKDIDDENVSLISTKYGLSKLSSCLLSGRKIDEYDVGKFLHPQLGQLPSPFLLKGVHDAVKIIHESIVNNEHIVLYGDYDVDGVTAVSVLANFLMLLNKKYLICHPNRIMDGYGLKYSVVNNLMAGERPGLVVTCDCGISDESEVSKLRNAGWKVIVTDHHQPPDDLPDANVIIDPWQTGCAFPFKDLAGVGVSFFLVMALRSYLVEVGYLSMSTAPNLKKLLDIVAIGTICDMVEVRGVNRILVTAGLDVLTMTNNHGLAKLLEQCGLSQRKIIYSEDISFKIGPRLNAPGRMGDAGLSSRLLTADNPENTQEIINKIELINDNRRQLTFTHIEQAKDEVDKQKLTGKPCIIIYRKDWHLGVIGIVASKLIEEYGLPAIALCGEGILKGSVRSIEGLNFHDILAECSDILVEFGGHSAACGFSVEESRLEALRSRLYDLVAKNLSSGETESTLIIDHSFADNEWEISEVEAANNALQPYGFNNFEPIYTLKSACELRNIQFIGKEKSHLRFQAKLGGSLINAIGFGFADAIRKHTTIENSAVKAHIAFSLRKNFFNHQETNQLFIHDLILESHA
nr:single-stranded-DNA-specific exonuclease RecJ [Desulfobulbaceae bacterium]